MKIFRHVFVSLAVIAVTAGIDAFAADNYVARYVGIFDAGNSGQPFRNIDDIYIDSRSKEIYVLDGGNKRVVIIDFEGVPTYWFDIIGFNTNGMLGLRVSSKSGDIYIATDSGIAVLDYKGRYKTYYDYSTKFTIKSMDMSSDGTKLYLGHLFKDGDVNRNAIAVVDLRGNIISTIKVDRGIDMSDLTIYGDRFYYFSSSEMSIVSVDMNGNMRLRFGKASSLLGGLSQVSSLAVTEDEHIIISDSNRMMIIAFDSTGVPLYEFGGFDKIAWPRKVAVDDKGRIFVADRSNNIYVFEIYKESLSGGIKKVGTLPEAPKEVSPEEKSPDAGSPAAP